MVIVVKDIVVGLVYKTPLYNKGVFIMEILMENFNKEPKYLVLAEDFNIDLFKGPGHLDFLKLMISLFLCLLVTIRTQVTLKPVMLIDNISLDRKLLECLYADASLKHRFDDLFLINKLKNSCELINKNDHFNRKIPQGSKRR